ncbi:restriction endonuclease subunit S [Butyricicoccus porcorum]|uniref:restriction endonuclease subunit S n=1 Tax=Butyricicoccus porcorum TaxID=1945634 RepID=UPI003F4AC715
MEESIKKRIEAVRRGEVPKGYVKTEAGTLPSDWSSAFLSAISDVLSEQAGDREFETLSISAGVGFVNQAEKFGKELSGKQYTKYTVLRRGDFAYNKGNSKRYPQGCTYMLREREEAAVPNVFECFRITQGRPEYYEQLFINGFMNKQLTRKINHGVRDDGLLNLTDDDFYSTVLPVPSLVEQQKIAEILATCDRVIELKQQLLEEKRRQKKWLMQTLLDPDSTAVVEKRLGDVCSINDCGIDGISDDSEIFYIDIASVDNGKVLFPEFTVKLQDAPVRARRTFKRGDILMSTVRPYLHAFAFVNFDADNYIASTGFSILRAKNGFSSRLVYQLLFTNEMDKQYSSVLVGSNYPALNTSDVENLMVCIPANYEKQEAVANALEAADRQISLLNSEIEAWQQKKKALMQLLLTGLVRV